MTLTASTMVSSVLALLLAGSMTGIYAAFSMSVLPAFDRVPAASAIGAMRGINKKIQNPVFFIAFFGTPVAAALAGALFLRLGQDMSGLLFLVAAGCYLLGSLLPTVLVNVPLNQRLDAAEVPSEPEAAARLWRDYSRRWTAWNTARAMGAGASLLLLGIGLLLAD